MLHDLPNIGNVLAGKLTKIGVDTPEELRRVGSREAFERIRINDHTACLHMLLALEGAVQGVRKQYLSDEDKVELKRYYHSLKQ